VRVQDDDEDVVRLATAILLELSFAMRARWLVRPVLFFFFFITLKPTHDQI